MKKCTQCGQYQGDDTKFCFKCGSGNFAPISSQGSYQQPVYQQPPYQAQPASNSEPAKIKDFLIFYLLMLIPIFNIVYLIIVAVGGPKYNPSLTNYVRASLIWAAIIFVLYIVLILIFGAAFLSLFSGGLSYSFGY